MGEVYFFYAYAFENAYRNILAAAETFKKQILKFKPMKKNIVVLGANGGTGRQCVEQGLKEGHNVTAILRNPAKLILSHPCLTIVQGNILKPETLEKHLENKDAVISAIGLTSFKETTLYSE